jgi:hypothetical protein
MLDAELDRMLSSPVDADGRRVFYTENQVYSLDQDQVRKVQLSVLRRRFAELRHQLPLLDKTATENRISTLDSLDDVVPLLTPHLVYKSYPMSLIDNCRFEQLNLWLNDLTTHDLSGLDVSGCESLEEWLNVVETETPVRVMTSSGTSGKISLLPWSLTEYRNLPYGYFAAYTPFRGERGITDFFAENRYYVMPFSGSSRHSSGIMIKMIRDGFGGDESHIYTLRGALSTDLLWMSGRVKKARADGNMERLRQTKAWKRLSEAQGELEARTGESQEELFRRVLEDLQGKKVVMIMGLTYYLSLVNCAEKYGLGLDFHPDSLFYLGGGLKWSISNEEMAKVKAAMPDELRVMYGFSEILNGTARRCTAGHYHTPPWIVSFILDPDTGAPYPREGVQRGRCAAFDLWAQTYWGGFISGDEVTVNWDGGCSCGRNGPYFTDEIIRFTEKYGGDDKITCQRTAAAVEEMIEFMNSGAD